MRPPDGVEFLSGDDDSDETTDEIVEFGRARTPRWIVAVLVVAALALGVTAIAAKSKHRRPVAQSAPTASAAPPSTVFTPYIGAALSIGPTMTVDVAVSGTHLYVLQVGRLAELDTQNSAIIAQVPVGNPADGNSLRLVDDPTGTSIWVITFGRTPTSITQFDARTLRPIRATSWPAAVDGAAELDGYLYLQTDGVAVLGPHDQNPHLIPGLSGPPGSIAADGLRHRLLILKLGSPTRILTYSRGGTVQDSGAALDVSRADLAVVDGHVWLGGYGPAGAELEQLDPVTFAPGPTNPLFAFLGAGARLVARGQHVVWVRAAPGQMSSFLSCINATDGTELRSWFGIEGQVASAVHSGFIADGSAVLPLQLGRCTG